MGERPGRLDVRAVTRAFEAGANGIAFLVAGAPFEGADDPEVVPGWCAGD